MRQDYRNLHLQSPFRKAVYKIVLGRVGTDLSGSFSASTAPCEEYPNNAPAINQVHGGRLELGNSSIMLIDTSRHMPETTGETSGKLPRRIFHQIENTGSESNPKIEI